MRCVRFLLWDQWPSFSETSNFHLLKYTNLSQNTERLPTVDLDALRDEVDQLRSNTVGFIYYFQEEDCKWMILGCTYLGNVVLNSAHLAQ